MKESFMEDLFGEGNPETSEAYELVSNEDAERAVTRYLLEGGVAPICHPAAKEGVQAAIDAVGEAYGFDDDQFERMREVVVMMAEVKRSAVADVLLEEISQEPHGVEGDPDSVIK